MKIRTVIILSVFANALSSIAIVLTGSEVNNVLGQVLLAVSYHPFIVVLCWSTLIGLSYFSFSSLSMREALVAFGVHTVAFAGWVVVMLVHFLVFRSHAKSQTLPSRSYR